LHDVADDLDGVGVVANFAENVLVFVDGFDETCDGLTFVAVENTASSPLFGNVASC